MIEYKQSNLFTLQSLNQTMKPCTTKPCTPNKHQKQISTMATIQPSDQRRKNITVYSAMKKQHHEFTFFETPRYDKNIKYQNFGSDKNQKELKGLLDRQQVAEISENRGIVVKMSLCGPKICDISVEGPYNFCQPNNYANQNTSQQSRVIFVKKGPKIMNGSDNKISQLIEGQNEINPNLAKQQFFNNQKRQFHPPIRHSQTIKNSNYLSFINERNSQKQEQSNNFKKLSGKKSRRAQQEKANNELQQMRNDQIYDNIKTLCSNNERNSLSIRNFSILGSRIENSLENIGSNNVSPNNLQNYSKLKEIYQNTFRSEASDQGNYLTKFNKNLQGQNVNKQTGNHQGSRIVFIGQKNIESAERSQFQMYRQNKQKDQINSSRSIIEMLFGWECESDRISSSNLKSNEMRM